jgi:hypothetical protein
VFSPASSLTEAVELPVIKLTRAAIMPFIKNTKQVQRGELLSGHPEIARIFIAINICCNRFFGRLRITSNFGLV